MKTNEINESGKVSGWESGVLAREVAVIRAARRIASACPECHPELFDGSLEVTPVPLACGIHAGGVIASFFCPATQEKPVRGVGAGAGGEPGREMMSHEEHNRFPRGRFS